MTAIQTRLRPARKPLLALHIVSSVGLLGATSSSLLLALVAATTEDPDLAHSAYDLISTQSLAFGIPLSFLSLFTGSPSAPPPSGAWSATAGPRGSWRCSSW